MANKVNEGERQVTVYGALLPLYVDPRMSSIGPLLRGQGISFRFGDEGCWVVPLDELRAIVREADEYRAKYGAAIVAELDARYGKDGG